MRERSQAKGLSKGFLEPDGYEDDAEDYEESLLTIKKNYKKKLAKGGVLFYFVSSFEGTISVVIWN